MRRPVAVVNGRTLRRSDDPRDAAADNVAGGYFVKYAEHGSPFDIQLEDEEGEDVIVINGVCCQFRLFLVVIPGCEAVWCITGNW